ncbi:nuclear transport factor 2 family protein [Tsukamurella sp. DT100]|uniref:nuclear transport factor 2 family protein n=1 Tax=Tsukamurella sp. DT100 TaxID=3393415 RepID=UPI003CF16474
MTVDELLARREIEDVVLRYCRGIDRLDPEAVRACYHPGAVDHHTGFDGPVEEYVPWVRGQLESLGGTHHQIGNHLSEIAGDAAVVETYCTATHWSAPDTELQAYLTLGLRYVDRFERRDGRWAIAERWAVTDWTRWEKDLTGPLGVPEAGPPPARGGGDPLDVLRAQVFGRERS